MADGIYYNQEMTAADLNDIAIDLGATSFNGFGVGKFGADELNSITAALVGKGVLLTENVCRPVIVGGKLYISTGTIVFETGAKKVITEPQEVLYEASTAIWAQNNQLSGTCSIVVGAEFPESGDVVRLASIDADKKLTDEREISTAKMALYAGNNEIVKNGAALVYAKWVTIATYSIAEWELHKYLLFASTGGFITITGIDLSGDTEYGITTKSSDELKCKFVTADETVSVMCKSFYNASSCKLILI